WVRGYFRIALALLAFLIGIADVSGIFYGRASSALSQPVSRFSLCASKDCNQSKYYVGYNRTNSVVLQGEEAKLGQKPDTILANVSDIALKNSFPEIDEQLIDREDGNYVSSVHRIPKVQIGFLRKSELMRVHTNQADASATATVKLFWGDTFTVTSRTLQQGSPVTVFIERIGSGFGNPVTDNAFYQANFKTFLNGQSLNNLDFNVKKEPGKGQKDQVSGSDKVTFALNTKVGNSFTLESLLEVKDGVMSGADADQKLNGADQVQHRINLAPEQINVVCVQSVSRKFSSGKC
ncbi:MAG: hypothetical protein WCA35_31445, partial [Kovacikia sp.]